MKSVLILILVLTSACATYPKHMINHFKDTQSFYKDRANCEVKSNQAGYGSAFSFGGRAQRERDFFVDCMRGEGWRAMSDEEESVFATGN